MIRIRNISVCYVNIMGTTNGFAKKYMCDLAIYLMTVLPSSFCIIMDRAINSPVNVNIVVDGLNATDKRFLNEKMDHNRKLENNNTLNIGMLPSASKTSLH